MRDYLTELDRAECKRASGGCGTMQQCVCGLAQDMVEEIDRLRARVAELERGWQPIETAPKDGTQVLVADGDVWMTAARNWPCDGYWIDDVASGRRLKEPTHWMPLPAPPAPTPSTASGGE